MRLIVNCNYMKYGKIVYIQQVGVPQGGLESSELASLYLYFYETTLNCVGYVRHRYNNDIICFVTDINCFINFNYPSFLEFIENISLFSQCTNFLDLSIKLTNNNTLNFDLYDKKNCFNFFINRIQHYSSLLHFSVFSNIIKNDVFRIKKICSNNNIEKHINF